MNKASAGVTLRRRDVHCGLLALALGLTGAAAPARATQAASERRLLVVGDSLSAEYGLARGRGWVALLEERLAASAMATTVINASISGDTTSGGRSRLPALLQRHRPTHVVIELGGNDALRGLPLSMTQKNLAAMVQAANNAGAKALLVGMQVPPNFGPRYARDFAGLFSTVAEAEKAALVPFLLAGVADRPDAMALFQADRIHPTAEAQPIMLDNVWSVLKPWLG